MSDETNVVSDNTAEPSGGSAEQSVSYESHKKAVGQIKNFRAKLEESNAKLAKYEADAEAAEEARLKETNEWKTIAEKKEAELLETRGTLNKINDSIVRAEKIDAFEAKLGAQLKNREYAKHINLEAIPTNESGEIDEEALDAEVSRFRDIHGDSLIKTNNIATLPNGAGAKPQPKSIEDMSAAERIALRKELRKK